MDQWLNMELSLAEEFDKERDRRMLAHMSRDQLSAHADWMVCQLYIKNKIAEQCLAKVVALTAEIAVLKAGESKGHNPPSEEHYRWTAKIAEGG